MHFSLQYYSYDFNSFIADVGGYLGLLLGHSIYSFYNVVAEWIRSRKDTLCSREKNVDELSPHQIKVTKVESF